MRFRTQYTEHPRFQCFTGSPEKVVYQARYDASGTLELYESGLEDLYGYIQSHRDSCDIHVILNRFANGELDVLSQVQGFYADTTGMPSTYAEVLNAVLDGERMFNSLPAELKQQFGNSFAQWLTAMDKPDFAQRMGWEAPEVAKTATEQRDFVGTPAPAPASVPVSAPVSGGETT